jgi:SPP1 gp7 family putative phage head morphogenesis protein
MAVLREPKNIELWYLKQIRSLWETIFFITKKGLSKLYAVWPTPRLDADKKTQREQIEDMQRLSERIEAPLRTRTKRPKGIPPWRIRGQTQASMHAPRIRPVAPERTRILPPIPDISTLSSNSINRIMTWIERSTNVIVDEELLHSYADWVAKITADRNAGDLGRILRIDLRKTIPEFLVNEFRESQVELITGALRNQLDDISNVVEIAHSSGLRVEELQKQVMSRFDVSKRRGALIARDQVLSLNAKVNQFRQKEIGITQYKWITAKDSRVRDKHKSLHGKIFDWSQPVGQSGYPGFEIQCRCIAQPIAPTWLDR